MTPRANKMKKKQNRDKLTTAGGDILVLIRSYSLDGKFRLQLKSVSRSSCLVTAACTHGKRDVESESAGCSFGSRARCCVPSCNTFGYPLRVLEQHKYRFTPPPHARSESFTRVSTTSSCFCGGVMRSSSQASRGASILYRSLFFMRSSTQDSRRRSSARGGAGGTHRLVKLMRSEKSPSGNEANCVLMRFLGHGGGATTKRKTWVKRRVGLACVGLLLPSTEDDCHG